MILITGSKLNKMSITKENLIQFLEKRIKEIEHLKSPERSNGDFSNWENTTKRRLEQAYGKNSSHVKDFISIQYGVTFSPILPPNNLSYLVNQAYHEGLEKAEKILKGIVEEIEEIGISSQQKEITQDSKQNVILNQTINQNQSQTQNINITIQNILKDNLTGKQFEELKHIAKERNEKTKLAKFGQLINKIDKSNAVEILNSLLKLVTLG